MNSKRRYDHERVAAYVQSPACRYISERTTFDAFWIQGQTVTTIANFLGVSYDAVAQRIRRLRLKARKFERSKKPSGPT